MKWALARRKSTDLVHSLGTGLMAGPTDGPRLRDCADLTLYAAAYDGQVELGCARVTEISPGWLRGQPCFFLRTPEIQARRDGIVHEYIIVGVASDGTAVPWHAIPAPRPERLPVRKGDLIQLDSDLGPGVVLILTPNGSAQH